MNYTLKGENIFEDDKSKGPLIDFLDDEYDVVESALYSLLHKSDVYGRKEKRAIETQVEELVLEHFQDFFKKNKEVDEDMLEEEVDKVIENLEGHGKGLKNINNEYIQKVLTKPSKAVNSSDLNQAQEMTIDSDKNKKTQGDDMFKNLKEAKMFTSHLDALAAEIETLGDVSPEMRTHLAFRLDRLSDLIEKSAGAEKLFNHDSVEGDTDEKKYMKEFNTDLTEEVSKEAKLIEQDKDESYMKEFNTDTYKEVSHAKSPKADHGEDSDALAIYVKKALSKLK